MGRVTVWLLVLTAAFASGSSSAVCLERHYPYQAITLNAELLLGTARVSITPDPAKFTYTLGGYADANRFAHSVKQVHDTCYARALYMKRGAVECAVVSLDLCYLPANVVDGVRVRLTRDGAGTVPLFIAATHTHSGPEPLMLHSGSALRAGDLPRLSVGLLEWVTGQIATAVEQAKRAVAPAVVSVGVGQHVGLNRNRRDEAETDDTMTVLKFTRKDGSAAAEVVNYAAHPTYFGAQMLQVSGDWVGAMELNLEATHPGSVCLFLNGAEGDASTNGADIGTADERIIQYSALVALAANRLLAASALQPEAELSYLSQKVALPVVTPHPIFLLASGRFNATPDEARAYASRMMPRTTQITLLRIGEMLLIGFPGEPTTPVGLAARSAAVAAGVKVPMIVALTNGWLGYLVTRKQYMAGRYEPTMSFYGPSIGELMLQGVSAALKALGSSGRQ